MRFVLPLPVALAAALAMQAIALPAWAGDAKSPEMTDPPNDAGQGAAWGDITAGWFNDTETDIIFTMQLAQLAAMPANHVWYVVADIGSGGNATFGWYLFNGPQGGAQFGYAHWDRAMGPKDGFPGKGQVSGVLIEMRIPRAFVNNVTAGTLVAKGSAGTGTIAADTVTGMIPFGQFVPEDAATGKDYVLAHGPQATALAPPPGSNPQPNGTPNRNVTGPAGSGDNAGGMGNESAGPTPSPKAAPGLGEPFLLAGIGAAAWVARHRRR